MIRKRIFPILFLLTIAGCAADGGQRGSGITSAEGNVAGIGGDTSALAGIQVTVENGELTTDTDAHGRFSLRGQFEGTTTVRFERANDQLSAHLDINAPAGGTLTMQNIRISAGSGEARPEAVHVVFEGRVVTLDCANGRVILASTQRDPNETDTYVVVIQSSTLHDREHQLRACADLRVDDRLVVDGIFADDGAIGNAEVTIE